MRRARWIAVGLGAVVAAVVVVFVWLRDRYAAEAQPTALEISHETTRILEPLTIDGGVDYAAALNAVDMPAPQENATIPLQRILGTDVLRGERAVVLAQLGAPDDLPTAGQFVPQPDELPFWDDFRELGEAQQTVLLRWIDANQDALDGLGRASMLPRLWCPVVYGPEAGALEYALPLEALQGIASALHGRAEARMAQGNPSEGWADAQALLRLQGLVDQRLGLLARFVAGGFRSTALNCLTRALAAGACDGSLCTQALEVLLRLPDRRDLGTDLDRFDRFWLLHCYIHIVVGEVERLGHVETYAARNAALRQINRAIDEVVPLLRLQTREGDAEARRRVDRLQARVKEEMAAERGSAGEQLTSMALLVVPMATSRLRRVELERQQAILALALRLHELEHADFPATLAELVPTLLESLATNPIDGTPISYERTDEGCVVGDGDSAIHLAR